MASVHGVIIFFLKKNRLFLFSFAPLDFLLIGQELVFKQAGFGLFYTGGPFIVIFTESEMTAMKNTILIFKKNVITVAHFFQKLFAMKAFKKFIAVSYY